MQILILLGIYFDASVVFVTNSSLLFRLAMAILWDSEYFEHSCNANTQRRTSTSSSMLTSTRHRQPGKGWPGASFETTLPWGPTRTQFGLNVEKVQIEFVFDPTAM